MGLFYHLLFFLCIAVLKENVNVRNAVIKDGVGELLKLVAFASVAVYERLRTVLKVVVALDARARNSLICRIYYALYAVFVLDRL